jgi:hypothetical protein
MLYVFESVNSFVDIPINFSGTFLLNHNHKCFGMFAESRNSLINRDNPCEEMTL